MIECSELKAINVDFQFSLERQQGFEEVMTKAMIQNLFLVPSKELCPIKKLETLTN
jgi:hypothetical protein